MALSGPQVAKYMTGNYLYDIAKEKPHLHVPRVLAESPTR